MESKYLQNNFYISYNVIGTSFILFNKCFLSDDPDVVAGIGKLKHFDRFDATFFSVHPNLCHVMDPMTRIVLERSIEAIIDAGLSPVDLYGTNTGVFMGSGLGETEMLGRDASNNSFAMLGISRTMQANRLSFILNLTGMKI